MPRLLPIIFWVALLTTFLVAVSPDPPEAAARISDKVQHFAAFALLTALGTAAYPKTPALLLGSALALFGVLIELVQLAPDLNRQASVADWIADAAGIAVVLGALALSKGLRRR